MKKIPLVSTRRYLDETAGELIWWLNSAAKSAIISRPDKSSDLTNKAVFKLKTRLLFGMTLTGKKEFLYFFLDFIGALKVKLY